MLFTQANISNAAIICFAVALRSIVSIYPYSGAATPPMYGDYEAQRHWQEICVNLPASSWYRNTTDNDLLYWGLDYPPLTAYHSFFLGKIARQLNSSYVELHTSRGYESDHHKNFMRLSVLVADILIYIPALVLAVKAINAMQPRNRQNTLLLQHLAVCLFYPGQILIDNGHFQYNNISLGLTTLAVIAILKDYSIFASIFFSLALNYKQMELYHAIPFFVFLLKSCFQEKNFSKGLVKLIKIGLSVIITFVLLWLPWLNSLENSLAVLRRIFPISRGVFEDKVSNVWCVLNVAIKLKTLFSNEKMALICLGVTAVTLLPSAIHLLRNPTKQGFLYALFNSALIFFLFSFQVHEKSILLVALPAMLLYPYEPFMMTWFLQISTFSMFPLIEKDKLALPFMALCIIFQVVLQFIRKMEPKTKNDLGQKLKWPHNISLFVSIALVVCHLYAPVPNKLPHIYVLAISAHSCIHFVAFLCYTSYRQFVIKNVVQKTKNL